ncbi:MAG: hypothetical protein AAF911_05855 [Planctomycetota bacterium]
MNIRTVVALIDTPIGMALLAGLIMWPVTVVAVFLCKTKKTSIITGVVGVTLTFLAGFLFSLFIHLLHVGTAGDPADSPFPWLIGIVIAAVIPQGLIVYVVIRDSYD